MSQVLVVVPLPSMCGGLGTMAEASPICAVIAQERFLMFLNRLETAGETTRDLGRGCVSCSLKVQERLSLAKQTNVFVAS